MQDLKNNFWVFDDFYDLFVSLFVLLNKVNLGGVGRCIISPFGVNATLGIQGIQ